MAFLAEATDHRFIHTICRPDELSGNPFKGDLGRWTPCFIDLALLGESVVDGSSRSTQSLPTVNEHTCCRAETMICSCLL